MSLDEELLKAAAKDGSIDYDQWPGQLEPLLERLDQIVRNEFLMPKVPQQLASSFAAQPASLRYPTHNSPQSSNKENATPADQPLYSETQETPEQHTQSTDGPPQSTLGDSNIDCLPAPLLSLLASIKSTLRTYFELNPPHTIQRLAELILNPTRQYRTLPAYLRAVDRVVSVSSSANIFPLPHTGGSAGTELSNGITNGTNTAVTDDSLGSDESLGGALLTPIPWLANPDLEVAHADMVAEGAVPSRTDAAVTQGELIRQEQEAGLIANSQPQTLSPGNPTENRDGDDRTSPQPDEIPHARGPSVVGVEDLGLQDGRGVQMTLSSSAPDREESSGEENSHKQSGEAPVAQEDGNGDADGDIVLDDVSAPKDTASAATGTEGSAEAAEADTKG